MAQLSGRCKLETKKDWTSLSADGGGDYMRVALPLFLWQGDTGRFRVD